MRLIRNIHLMRSTVEAIANVRVSPERIAAVQIVPVISSAAAGAGEMEAAARARGTVVENPIGRQRIEP